MLYQPMNEKEFSKKTSREGLKLALIAVTSGVLMAVAVSALLILGGIW